MWSMFQLNSPKQRAQLEQTNKEAAASKLLSLKQVVDNFISFWKLVFQNEHKSKRESATQWALNDAKVNRPHC